MSKKKAFVLALLGTLVVSLPIYLLFAALCLHSAATPADNAVVDIPMARPMSGDAKNVLMIVNTATDSAFVILRFDALENKICALALETDTVLLCAGKPLLLKDAVAVAGPEQARLGIEETLGISVADYVLLPSELLVSMAAPLGSGSLRLANYLGEEALGQLKLLVEGVENIELSALRLAEVLSSGLVPEDKQAAIRADAYLAFLRSAQYSLAEVIPEALRKNSRALNTSITATDIYEYERVLRFLAKSEIEYKAGVLCGVRSNGRYELNDEALAQAKLYLA